MRIYLPDPRKGEMFGIADQIVGGSRIMVVCADGRTRLSRIPGKMKRRMWIREGDLVIISVWEFQEDKADIRYRYTKTQAGNLSRRGLVPDSIDIF